MKLKKIEIKICSSTLLEIVSTLKKIEWYPIKKDLDSSDREAYPTFMKLQQGQVKTFKRFLRIWLSTSIWKTKLSLTSLYAFFQMNIYRERKMIAI